MISFSNIRSIARYERKILLRSWFFRIFAILSLFIIGMFSGVNIFEPNRWNWMYRSLPSAMIYSDIFLLNIFQSVIAVFLATDFLKRDKKLNTSEVLFIRPMTNSEYIWGKTFGLMTVFVILDLFAILLTSVFLMVSKQVEFQLLPVIYYFLLLCVPTLLFIIGLSYALMIIIKNQPIAFVLLLGYIALILFYLGEKANYVFDYMVFAKPMVYSDVIGFSHLKDILIHRGSYFLLGVGLIYFTIWRLNRLPNKKQSNYFVAFLGFVFIGLSVYGLYFNYATHQNNLLERKAYAEACNTNFDRYVPELLNATIKVDQQDMLKASSLMEIKNTSENALDTLLFSLNPGLLVTQIMANEKEMQFAQEGMLIFVFLDKPLNISENLEIEIQYEGIPDFNIAYLDNEDEEVFGYTRANTVRVNRDYGFYTKDYVLLTKENLWYPIPGIAYDPIRPAMFQHQFTSFQLEVSCKEGMLPISQGTRTTTDSLNYKFKVRDPIPQLSLTIGKYEERIMDVDGLEIALAYFEGHDGLLTQLDELGDTLVDLTLEFLDDYERPLGMYYPYSRFTLVEAPVQFTAHPHSWTSTMAQSQPQMVYFPEYGFNVQSADFASFRKRIERDNKRNKEGLSEKDIQARLYTNFVKRVFGEDNAEVGFGNMQDAGNSNPYSIYPNYFYYVNYITSDECPVLNYAFESYLLSGEDDPRTLFMQRSQGIGDAEKANLKLKEKSLKQIIAEEEQEVVSTVLGAKGAYLLTWMEKQIDNPEFNEFLRDYLYDNSYYEITYTNLAKAITDKFNVELGSFISDWYNTNSLPSFGIGAFKAFEVIDNAQAMFLVRTTVSNYSNVDGMVKFTHMLGGGRGPGGGGGQMETDEHIFLIEANTTKELQMVLSQSPRMIIFNTLLSENIPSTSMEFGLRAEKNSVMVVEEYERVIDQPVETYTAGELIVDNTDSGFSTADPALENPLRQFVEKRKQKDQDTEYVGSGWGQGPSTWSLHADADYFGTVIHSAMMIRSGEGTKTATWTSEIPAAAYYDVYVNGKRQRSRRGPGRGGDRGRQDPKGSYFYTVEHDDGVEQIEFELKDMENGWNLLGSFYISSDSASVTLSDAGGADRVIADAVKWVKQQ